MAQDLVCLNNPGSVSITASGSMSCMEKAKQATERKRLHGKRQPGDGSCPTHQIQQ